MDRVNFKKLIYIVTRLKIGKGASLKSNAGSEKIIKIYKGLNPLRNPA